MRRVALACVLAAGLGACDQILEPEPMTVDTSSCINKGAADYVRAGFTKKVANAYRAGELTFDQYVKLMTQVGRGETRASQTGDYTLMCQEIASAAQTYKIR